MQRQNRARQSAARVPRAALRPEGSAVHERAVHTPARARHASVPAGTHGCSSTHSDSVHSAPACRCCPGVQNGNTSGSASRAKTRAAHRQRAPQSGSSSHVPVRAVQRSNGPSQHSGNGGASIICFHLKNALVSVTDCCLFVLELSPWLTIFSSSASLLH